jgi:hypothetical protein
LYTVRSVARDGKKNDGKNVLAIVLAVVGAVVVVAAVGVAVKPRRSTETELLLKPERKISKAVSRTWGKKSLARH